MLIPCLIFLFLATGCSTEETVKNTPSYWQEINSRDEGNPALRFPIYRAKVPLHWIRQDPEKNISIKDTTKAICEFYIDQENEKLRITVHSFPTETKEQQIPPFLQIHRWKRQFDDLSPVDSKVSPLSNGGFVGFSFEAVGSLNGVATVVLGWSMQMASEHYYTLQNPEPSLSDFYQKQRRADYTIKAVGSPSMMNQHKKEIQVFAKSFELIEEIPAR